MSSFHGHCGFSYHSYLLAASISPLAHPSFWKQFRCQSSHWRPLNTNIFRGYRHVILPLGRMYLCKYFTLLLWLRYRPSIFCWLLGHQALYISQILAGTLWQGWKVTRKFWVWTREMFLTTWAYGWEVTGTILWCSWDLELMTSRVTAGMNDMNTLLRIDAEYQNSTEPFRNGHRMMDNLWRMKKIMSGALQSWM